MELKTIFLILSVIPLISIAFAHESSSKSSSSSSNCEKHRHSLKDEKSEEHKESLKHEKSEEHEESSKHEGHAQSFYIDASEEDEPTNTTEGSRGIGGNEIGESCNQDSDCLRRLACRRYQCYDPCSPNLCIYQPCRVKNHKVICGYPCSKNRDCKGSEICDMTILQCRNACNPSPCGINEVCNARNHKAHCRCARHYNRNYWGVCSPCRQYARYDGVECWCEKGKMPRCKKP